MTSKKQSKTSNKYTVIIFILIALIIAAVGFLSLNLYKDFLFRAHPMEYSEFVEQSANEHELDKFLIYAIIKTESGFNHEAVSELGARGLMQIMPDAFEWIKNYRLFEDDITYDDMFNPQDNIRYGTYFISHNMERYEGNINNSLAAYHAGISAVDGWLLNKEYSSDGKTLHTIPISQTSHYVNKVNKAYEMYLELYEK